MKKRTSRLLSILLALCMALALLPGTAWAADSPEISSNRSKQNYSVYYASPVTSYLYENENGELTRVEYVSDHIVVEDYSSDFVFQSGQSIPMELNIWGGFFAGETYNFFVFGQMNTEEDDNKEVIRVVKYSKDWQRLGQASLYGANTETPFRSGSLRAAEYEGELYIRTSHRMYTSSDGKNHQANLTMAVRENDMKVTDSAYEVAFYGSNYVSHSFNQFILVDHEQRIVALDHGDAYPRSAVLAVFPAKAGSENITNGFAKEIEIQNFPGAIGDNTTGASLGGLAETTNGYVVAYNYDGAGSSNSAADRSVYFAYVDKDSLNVEMKVISGVGTKTPVLAPTSLDGGYILWNTSNDSDTLNYAAYSDGGSVGEVKTAAAPLSDCQPILYNGKVVWYATNNTTPTFYQLDENGVTSTVTEDEHHFSDAWSSDETSHWHACTDSGCTEKSDEAAHTWNTGVVTVAPTNNKEGTRTYTCIVCKYIRTEGIPKTESGGTGAGTGTGGSTGGTGTGTGTGSTGGTVPSTSGDIPVTVNGKFVTWTDAAPFIDANNRTMVPLRAVADAMGLDVNWDPAAREASFSDGSKMIYFPIGSSTAHTSGGGTVTMDTAAVIVNDRTYAPIRYLAEYFGYSVEWDAAARTVVIT